MSYRTKWNIIMFSPSVVLFLIQSFGVIDWNWWMITALMSTPLLVSLTLEIIYTTKSNGHPL